MTTYRRLRVWWALRRCERMEMVDKLAGWGIVGGRWR